MYQIQSPSLRPMTTAHLAQTMTLLNQTIDELYQQIQQELTNPALELVEERRCPTCHRALPASGVCPVCTNPSMSSEEPVVFVSPRDDFYGSSGGGSQEWMGEEPTSAAYDELPVYVLKQIALELDADEKKIAAYLLTHLDDDGFLTVSFVEVARYLHVLPSEVEAIQNMIKRADPVGVGAYTPQEALLTQLEVLAESGEVPAFASRIVSECMDMLSHRQHSEIARYLQIPLAQVTAVVKFIHENLNPFPARSHWGDFRVAEPAAGDVYYQPDIIISHLNDLPQNPLVVEIIMPIGGFLRVNPMFRKAIKEVVGDSKDAMKSDLDRAALFVKCLQQRNHTMQRLLQRVVNIQHDYIVYGDRYIKPLTRAQISLELEVHESTISRAVSNKTVQLPNKKIIPLASFFDRSLNVRTALRDIISSEPRPLSDSQLAKMLSQQGYDVARRTVAKYRAMEGILPAHLRRALAQ